MVRYSISAPSHHPDACHMSQWWDANRTSIKSVRKRRELASESKVNSRSTTKSPHRITPLTVIFATHGLFSWEINSASSFSLSLSWSTGEVWSDLVYTTCPWINTFIIYFGRPQRTKHVVPVATSKASSRLVIISQKNRNIYVSRN